MKTLKLFFVAVVLSIPLAASAGIVSTSGAIEIIPPPVSVLDNQLTSDSFDRAKIKAAKNATLDSLLALAKKQPQADI